MQPHQYCAGMESSSAHQAPKLFGCPLIKLHAGVLPGPPLLLAPLQVTGVTSCETQQHLPAHSCVALPARDVGAPQQVQHHFWGGTDRDQPSPACFQGKARYTCSIHPPTSELQGGAVRLRSRVGDVAMVTGLQTSFLPLANLYFCSSD